MLRVRMPTSIMCLPLLFHVPTINRPAAPSTEVDYVKVMNRSFLRFDFIYYATAQSSIKSQRIDNLQ